MKIAFAAIFLALSLNTMYAQCNSSASAGTVSSNTDKICVGSTETFWSTGWAGGSWSSSNSSIVQITPASNGNANIKGLTSGTVDIIYTFTQPNCATILTSKKTITVLGTTLGTVGEISGAASQCSGNTGQVYSIPAVTGGPIYTWSVPNGAGWAIVSGQGTNSINVTIGAGNGNIAVIVSNPCASGTNSVTKSFAVTISNNKTATPTISGNTSLCSGGSVTLTSSDQDSYLWSTGQTTKSITVSTAGSYTVKTTKSGFCQSDLSAPANVTMGTTTAITTQPTAPAVTCAGTGTRTISVIATGTGLSYSWRKGSSAVGNTGAISGQGTSTLTLTNPSASDAGNYDVVITGSCGNVTSNPVTVTINTAPTITTQPIAPVATCSGTGTQTISVIATGTNLSYVWKKDGVTISNGGVFSGQGTTTLTLTNPTTTDQGNYTVEISGICTPALTSNQVAIKVNPILNASVTITSDQPTKFCQGTGVRFNTTTVNSGTAPTYQWYKNNIAIANQTGNTILFFDLVDGDKVKVIMTSSNAAPCLAGIPATSNEIQVQVYMTDRGYTSGGQHICLGSPSPLLKLVNASNPNNGAPYSYPEKVLRWEYSDNNNATWTPINNTNGLIEYQPPVLSASRNYRAVAQGKKDNNDPCPITEAAVETRIFVDPVPTVTFTSQAATDSCIGTSITYTTQANQTNYAWTVTGILNTDYSISGGSLSNNSNTVTLKWLKSGSKTVTVNYSNGNPYNCSAITPTASTTYVYPTPVAPTLVSKIVPTCTVPTGSITLSGLPATGIVRYLAKNSATATYTITGTTMTISGLAPGKYRFATENPCSTLYSDEIDISGNTWNGTTWSGGNAGPRSNDILIFEGDYTATNDIAACSCTITNNAKVTVNTGKTLTLSDFVNVDSGSLTFENNASLIQTNPNAVNSGSINYKRSTPEPGIRQADYVYWSSPVKDQTLVGVSQDLTAGDKYYMYGGTGISWIGVPKTTVMVKGKGYIIRGPQNWSNTDRNVYTATFKGTPNNGSFTTNEGFQAGKSYLLGNPYPSALDADKLIKGNPALKGTLYFWTHNTPVVLVGAYKYNADDYASYNLTGGVGTAPDIRTGTPAQTGNNTNNKSTPSGKIGAGQSFMAPFKDAGEITFTNDMRIGGTENSQFFKPVKTSKTTATEKHRVWLNFANTEGAFKQLLVGYIEGATNDFEGTYDGLSLDGNKYVDFYSISNATRYTIQGRALPFTDADTVPLGYKSSIAGDFTISINQADGALSTQAIYLEDKMAGKIHDLTTANYTFTTEIGTFEDRFVLRYTNKTLGTGDFENVENGLLVSVKDKTIKVASAKEAIKEVTVFDISGKLIYNKKKVGSTDLEISNLQTGNQVLLVKVVLENASVTTKKIIFN